MFVPVDSRPHTDMWTVKVNFPLKKFVAMELNYYIYIHMYNKPTSAIVKLKVGALDSALRPSHRLIPL